MSTELAERLGSEDTDESDDAETPGSAADEPQAAANHSTWRRRLIVAAIAVLVLTLGGVGGFFGRQYVNERQIANAGAAALNTANSYAVTLTSVDTDNLDANFAAVLDGSTGEFHDMYAKSSSELRKLLIDHKATGHGVVVNSAVKSATTDEVVVLLFVDQTVTNTDVPDPRVDRSRMVMTMQNIDGRWKAAKVELP
ncbi:Mce protein [Mycobacterium sp. NPDC051198]